MRTRRRDAQVNCHSDKSAKKQVDALRQVAFKSIATLFAPSTTT